MSLEERNKDIIIKLREEGNTIASIALDQNKTNEEVKTLLKKYRPDLFGEIFLNKLRTIERKDDLNNIEVLRERKIQKVEELILKGFSRSDIAKELKIEEDSLYRFIVNNCSELFKKKKVKIDPLLIIKDREKGHSLPALRKKHSICIKSLRNILKAHRPDLLGRDFIKIIVKRRDKIRMEKIKKLSGQAMLNQEFIEKIGVTKDTIKIICERNNFPIEKTKTRKIIVEERLKFVESCIDKGMRRQEIADALKIHCWSFCNYMNKHAPELMKKI